MEAPGGVEPPTNGLGKGPEKPSWIVFNSLRLWPVVSICSWFGNLFGDSFAA